MNNLNNRYADKKSTIDEVLGLATVHFRLSPEQSRDIETALTLCDIGNVMLPEGILNKPGSLTEEERKVVDLHPLYSVTMLRNYNNGVKYDKKINEEVLALIAKHNARYFTSDEEPTTAQQLVVAIDNFSAMIQKRPNRGPMEIKSAINALKSTKYGTPPKNFFNQQMQQFFDYMAKKIIVNIYH